LRETNVKAEGKGGGGETTLFTLRKKGGKVPA